MAADKVNDLTLTRDFDQIEAATSGWDAQQPPESGWVSVSLPDVWTQRWRNFDGVVWYRLTWLESGAIQPRAILLEYMNMAGSAYLNGSLLDRDESLVEPLSRAWNTPRMWMVDNPLLHKGINTLIIRVSGLSAYSPGLGNVVRGDPATVAALFRQSILVRRNLQLFGLAISATLGTLFLALWLMRRQESAYGWFAAVSIAWLCFAYNQVATTPWPFESTDNWEKFSSISFLFYSLCFTVFVLRICRLRTPRVEFGLWAVLIVGCVCLIRASKDAIPGTRALWALIPMLQFSFSCCLLLWLSWRSHRKEQRVLSVCMVVFLAVGVHDLLVFVGIFNTNIYYAAQTSPILMFSMAVALAWRFAQNVRRIEHFNEELRSEVNAATEELGLTLNRQHALEVTNARLAERLNLAHDLHDGLGGTLVSSIAALEHSPRDIPPEKFLSLLKELRDDLRIVIDTASIHQASGSSLAEQLGPLRHRMSRIFESRQIECSWSIVGLEHNELPATQVLDVMRILQEALTNVLKHSRANSVWVLVCISNDSLVLRVNDDGVGFEYSGTGHSPNSTGLRSIRNRANRLGATLKIDSTPGSTSLLIHK